jgi:hypothetical protein
MGEEEIEGFRDHWDRCCSIYFGFVPGCLSLSNKSCSLCLQSCTTTIYVDDLTHPTFLAGASLPSVAMRNFPYKVFSHLSLPWPFP